MGQSYGLSSSHLWICELDHKEGWALKNWCFQIVVLEKTLESHLYSKEIKPVHPKGNQPWILTGRTNAEAEAPILWPSDGKSRLIGKRPWSWERLKAKEEEGCRGWDGIIASPTQEHELGQTPGDSEGQGGLACWSPRGCKESDTT